MVSSFLHVFIKFCFSYFSPFLLELWGLNEHGTFVSEGESEVVTRSTILPAIQAFITRRQRRTVVTKTTASVPNRIKADIEQVIEQTNKEMDRFEYLQLSDREKSKRILFYFQKDLTAGLSGQVLESQDKRHQKCQAPCSKTMKRLCWFTLSLVNAGMLYYIFLFGVSRDTHHQAAWAKSFAMWLLMEIVLVSSAVVLVMHVLIPSLLMKDVRQIRMKLIDTIVKYNRKLHEAETTLLSNQELQPKISFNAAKYLFVSYRLACLYPELRVSKVIAAYETIWPRQSYLHAAANVTRSYSKGLSGIKQAVIVLLVYAISSFVVIPVHLQDMAMQIISTVVLGYSVLIHLQLYQIYPVLVAVPTLIGAAVLHFIVKSNVAQEKMSMMTLLHHNPESTSQQDESKDEVVSQMHLVQQKDHRKAQMDKTKRLDSQEEGKSQDLPLSMLNRRQSIAIGMTMLQHAREEIHNPALSGSEDSYDVSIFPLSSETISEFGAAVVKTTNSLKDCDDVESSFAFSSSVVSSSLSSSSKSDLDLESIEGDPMLIEDQLSRDFESHNVHIPISQESLTISLSNSYHGEYNDRYYEISDLSSEHPDIDQISDTTVT
jgi:hypothetical protein